MQVTNIRVSFMREKQPVQYEKAQPSVELSAVLEDHETDYVAAARKLMLDAATVVYAGIGYDVPEKVATALLNGSSPAGNAVMTETTVEENTEETASEDKPKPRGRPRGSKNTAPKKPNPSSSNTAVADDVVLDAIPQIQSNPENRVDPADTDGIPEDDAPVTQEPLPSGETEVAEQEYTAKDLHDFVSDAVTKGKLSPANGKQLYAHFKVTRARDLTPEQVLQGRDMVMKMMEASQ